MPSTPAKAAPAAAPVPASPAAPAPKPRPHGPPVRFHAIIQAVPALALAGGFLAMIFHAVPKDNHDYVVSIVSGLLGYLTHAAVTRLGVTDPAGK